MTATDKPTESTALAPSKRDAIGKLPPAVQAAIELRRMQNTVVAELAKLNWGAKVDDNTRRAAADWCRRNDVDPGTELDVLGNRLYKNANYYLRKLGEMVARELVEYAVADHVEQDDRLAKLAEVEDAAIKPKAQAELSRRLFERIQHGIPDKAAAAVVFRVKLRHMEQEVAGVSYCGGGTRRNDPVGDERPGPTAETRAARRAIRLIATQNPDLGLELQQGDTEAEILGERIHDQAKVIDAQRPAHVQLPVKSPADPFALVPEDEDNLPGDAAE